MSPTLNDVELEIVAAHNFQKLATTSRKEKRKQNDLSLPVSRSLVSRDASNGMELRGSHLILLVSVLFPTTMTITFTLAVSSEHVYPIMPFMSYTGDRPVESCIFSLGLNLVAVLYIIISYLRYSQIIDFCENGNPPHSSSILRMNRNSLAWGLTSEVGLSVTGSFQELHVASVHRLGALICTYTGFVYLWYQTVISDLLVGKLNSTRVSCLRTALSFASTTVHVVAPFLVGILDTSYPKCHEDTLLWSKDEEGWHLHVCCSFLEWTVFFINVTYVATFYDEFKLILIRKDEIVFEGVHQEQRTQTSGHRKVK